MGLYARARDGDGDRQEGDLSDSPDAMAERVRRLVEALVEAQLGGATLGLEPMEGGIGTRRFFRIQRRDEPRTLVARVEAPEDPAGRPGGAAAEPGLEPLRSFLESRGLPVPRRYGGDAQLGIDLLEDLGSLHLDEAASRASDAERQELYALAVALVPQLQRLRDPSGRVPAFRRHLGRDLFAYKAELFARESVAAALGRAPRASETRVVEEAFAWIAELAARAPQRLAHRDLHGQNLHVRSTAGAKPRITMVDFQGAFLAPPEYDLVCLLRDSYVELPEAQVQAHLAAVRSELPDRPPPGEFAQRFDLLTLTRKGKDHARFLYAARSRRDRRFLRYLPTTVRALRAAAARCAPLDPRLARLAELVDLLPEAPCAA